MNDREKIKRIIEALLMSSSVPLSIEKIKKSFEDWERPETTLIQSSIESLMDDYQNSSIELKLLASGYVFQSKPEYSPWINRLQFEKPSKYSKALIETLAIIAYKQPVTRADIEEIRGVAVNSQVMKTLQERDWIKIAGHRDVAGKPAVYVTTKAFLNYFNLTSISELPDISEFTSNKKSVELNEQ